MCAAKLERTGFVLRHVWPNVKHFANEQSTTLAQSANESSSSFVRKNSNKVVAQQKFQPRLRFGARPTSSCRAFAAAASSQSPTQPQWAPWEPEQRPWQATAAQQEQARHEDPVRGLPGAKKSGASIDELVQAASEKYDLNKDFWGRYTDIPAMAQASEKVEILHIIENFVMIHRKHVYLFQRLKNTVLRNLDMWSAPDFAALCHAWAQLGFLHEDLCVAMAQRVASTAHACNAQELVWLMDAYATARCSVQSVNDELVKQTLLQMDDFSLSQLCLHASSFARLNLKHPGVFRALADRFEEAAAARGSGQSHRPLEERALSAREVTLAAYSFAKLGFYTPEVFDFVARRALEVIRDFTARDLQMLMVALVRTQHFDPDLLDGVSVQAQRRIAQFNSESLVLLLRSMAFFGMKRDPLFTRAIVQLPRAISTFRPADVTTLLNAFAAVQVHSPALFDVVTPFILEKSPFFTPADWLSALRGYSALGRKDSVFLSALELHMDASKLSLQQLCAAMVDCSRLSFAGLTTPLVEAAAQRGALDDGTTCSTDAAAQMYTALLLLGEPARQEASSGVRGFLRQLALRLQDSSLPQALTPTTCASLCYATMLAAPIAGGDTSSGRHPVDALVLAEHCADAAAQRAPLAAEDRLLLWQVRRALRLLPWNLRAVRSEMRLQALSPAAGIVECSSLPAPFLLAAVGHLLPHCSPSAWWQQQQQQEQQEQQQMDLSAGAKSSVKQLQAASKLSGAGASQSATTGIFVAYEIHDALEDVSGVLTSCGIQHRLVLDAETEVHIAVQHADLSKHVGLEDVPSGSSKEIALVWGSTIHYVSNGDSGTDLPLSPAAQFEVAYLKATGVVDAVFVIPHWWWLAHRHSRLGELGRALAEQVLEEMA